jgi:hypothetical protein|tara:strand:+ start:96 stop:830 length:735 start_codon:yes stop_codon:yes gene_type:complete
MSESGYIYCLSNESMPGIIKVGMTGSCDRTPDIRAQELSNTSGVPIPFHIEFAKKVLNPKQKEITLHKLLSLYTVRVNPKREFFKVPPENVKLFFDLLEGEWWEKEPTLCIDSNQESIQRVSTTYTPSNPCSDRCEVRMWGHTNHSPFRQCTHKGFKNDNFVGICCKGHQKKLYPSKNDPDVLTPVLGWIFNPYPRMWNDYSMFGSPKGCEGKSCNGKVDETMETNTNKSTDKNTLQESRLIDY